MDHTGCIYIHMHWCFTRHVTLSLGKQKSLPGSLWRATAWFMRSPLRTGVDKDLTTISGMVDYISQDQPSLPYRKQFYNSCIRLYQFTVLHITCGHAIYTMELLNTKQIIRECGVEWHTGPYSYFHCLCMVIVNQVTYGRLICVIICIMFLGYLFYELLW